VLRLVNPSLLIDHLLQVSQQSLIKTLATLQQRFKVKDPLDIPEPAQVSKAILQATPTVFTTEVCMAWVFSAKVANVPTEKEEASVSGT
jgi:hypothetical protein